MKKRWLASFVAICMLVQIVPVYVFATGEDNTGSTQQYYLENDRDPYTGQMTAATEELEYTWDTSYNSVGIDLGSKQKINYVIVKDADGLNRMLRTAVSLYVSDDNVSYDKIKDFSMINTGDSLYLYNYEVEGRYMKVHCHYDGKVVPELTADADNPSFINQISNMIEAGYSDELLGNGGGSFKKLGDITIKVDKTGIDMPVYLSYEELALQDGALKEDKSDLRFVYSGEMLQYWLDKEGAYVRMPATTKNTEMTIDIYGGNANAVSLSDIDATFEVAYGNKTLMNLSASTTEFNSCIVVSPAPNGDLLALGSSSTGTTNLVSKVIEVRRSTDGGRTWGEVEILREFEKQVGIGGSLVKDNKMWLFIMTRDENDIMVLQVMTSEDNGYNWSQAQTIDTDKYYSLTNADAVIPNSYDGDGPGVDYVTTWLWCNDNTYSQSYASAIYSKDDGKTWEVSESVLTYGSGGAAEAGVSENAITKLADGTLMILARVQYAEIDYFGQSFSYDNGITWSDITISNVPTVNTMPALENYKDDVVVAWTGNSNMGGNSYKRRPLTLAYAKNDTADTFKNGAEWLQKLDLWSGTSIGDYQRKEYKTGATDTDFTNYKGDGDDLFLAWWEQQYVSNSGMLIEEFDDFLHKTKGAGDDFESSVAYDSNKALYEEWQRLSGDVSLSTEQAASGKQSLKIQDINWDITRVHRSIPMMNKGQIAFDLYIQEWESELYLELKSTYNTSRYKSSLATLHVADTGLLSSINPNTGKPDVAIDRLHKEQWYRVVITFDLESANPTAAVSINGGVPVNISVNTETTDGGVCYVQFSDGYNYYAPGLTCYVDNFVACELAEQLHTEKCNVNFDTFVDIRDLARIKKRVADTSVEIDVTAADFDANGNLNTTDVDGLRKWLVEPTRTYTSKAGSVVAGDMFETNSGATISVNKTPTSGKETNRLNDNTIGSNFMQIPKASALPTEITVTWSKPVDADTLRIFSTEVGYSNPTKLDILVQTEAGQWKTIENCQIAWTTGGTQCAEIPIDMKNITSMVIVIKEANVAWNLKIHELELTGKYSGVTSENQGALWGFQTNFLRTVSSISTTGDTASLGKINNYNPTQAYQSVQGATVLPEEFVFTWDKAISADTLRIYANCASDQAPSYIEVYVQRGTDEWIKTKSCAITWKKPYTGTEYANIPVAANDITAMKVVVKEANMTWKKYVICEMELLSSYDKWEVFSSNR